MSRKKKKNKSFNVFLVLVLTAAIFASLYCIFDAFITKELHPLAYHDYIVKYSKEYGVPPEIISAVIDVESNFDIDAVSHRNAIGLMQITPETFTWLCTKIGGSDDEELLHDAETNIKYGTFFLSYLYDEFGVWETAYAAYNAGRGRINNWLKDENISSGGRLTNIPIKETREYVEKVENARAVYKKTYFDEP